MLVRIFESERKIKPVKDFTMQDCNSWGLKSLEYWFRNSRIDSSSVRFSSGVLPSEVYLTGSDYADFEKSLRNGFRNTDEVGLIISHWNKPSSRQDLVSSGIVISRLGKKSVGSVMNPQFYIEMRRMSSSYNKKFKPYSVVLKMVPNCPAFKTLSRAFTESLVKNGADLEITAHNRQVVYKFSDEFDSQNLKQAFLSLIPQSSASTSLSNDREYMYYLARLADVDRYETLLAGLQDKESSINANIAELSKCKSCFKPTGTKDSSKIPELINANIDASSIDSKLKDVLKSFLENPSGKNVYNGFDFSWLDINSRLTTDTIRKRLATSLTKDSLESLLRSVQDEAFRVMEKIETLLNEVDSINKRHPEYTSPQLSPQTSFDEEGYRKLVDDFVKDVGGLYKEYTKPTKRLPSTSIFKSDVIDKVRSGNAIICYNPKDNLSHRFCSLSIEIAEQGVIVTLNSASFSKDSSVVLTSSGSLEIV